MRKLSMLFALSMFLFGCAEKRQARYLQSQKTQLSQPMVNATSTIIDSSVTLAAHFRMEKAKLFYTDDGKTPTQKSTMYSKPLELLKPGLYSFKAFHPDWKSSEITTVKLYEKGVLPVSVDWQTTSSEQYPGIGKNTLLNNKKANLNFTNTQWIGYANAASASFKFKKKTYLGKVTLGYLVDTKSWIFPPQSVTVHFSKKDSVHIVIPTLETETKRLDDIEITVDKELDILKITVYNLKELPDWHAGAGNSAWLFMDEWIFNQ